jgi:hypothetical protein
MPSKRDAIILDGFRVTVSGETVIQQLANQYFVQTRRSLLRVSGVKAPDAGRLVGFVDRLVR